jgi:hypothetical protein
VGGRYDGAAATAVGWGLQREAISASGALNRPRHKAGGRTASIASSFSDLAAISAAADQALGAAGGAQKQPG